MSFNRKYKAPDGFGVGKEEKEVTHMKRSRMMMIPFIIMFIWGVFLIMRPRQQVQVTKVVEK